MIFPGLFAKLNALFKAEQPLARTDSLAVRNYHAFVQRLDCAIAEAMHEKSVLSIASIEIDDFEDINDSDGHAEADRALQMISRILSNSINRTDFVMRRGTSGFLLLLPNTNAVDAKRFISEARQSFFEARKAGTSMVTCSFGTVTFLIPPNSADAALQVIDSMMYRIQEGEDTNALAWQVVSKRQAT